MAVLLIGSLILCSNCCNNRGDENEVSNVTKLAFFATDAAAK
jgi:hypothetical protein